MPYTNKEKKKLKQKEYDKKRADKQLKRLELWRKQNPEKVIAARKIWIKKNKEHLKQLQYGYRQKNKKKYLSGRREYYHRTKIKRKFALQAQGKRHRQTTAYKEWLKKNRDKILISKKRNYLKNSKNIIFKLNLGISNYFKQITKKTFRYCPRSFELGYNIKELKAHLEKQFDSKMSWDNYGTYWHIDHIIPLSWFKTKEQVITKAWALKNLQPLEKDLNIKKQNKYVGNPKTNLPVICLPTNKGVDEEW